MSTLLGLLVSLSIHRNAGFCLHPELGSTKKFRRAPSAEGELRAEVVTVLVKIWEVLDYPCGQRLAPGTTGTLHRPVFKLRRSCSPLQQSL